MGPGILPETIVGKHNPPCHLQMPTKSPSYKKEAIYEHGPETPSCPVGQGSFKMDCLHLHLHLVILQTLLSKATYNWAKVEKCSMVWRVQNLTFMVEIT